MDNNASNETSEASVIRNREDVQDIFQIEGENGALGTVQNKQESPWVDGGHSRLLVNDIRASAALHTASQSLALTLECQRQNNTKMLPPQRSQEGNSRR